MQQVTVVWLWLSDVISALIYSLETVCVLFYPKLLQPHLWNETEMGCKSSQLHPLPLCPEGPLQIMEQERQYEKLLRKFKVHWVNCPKNTDFWSNASLISRPLPDWEQGQSNANVWASYQAVIIQLSASFTFMGPKQLEPMNNLREFVDFLWVHSYSLAPSIICHDCYVVSPPGYPLLDFQSLRSRSSAGLGITFPDLFDTRTFSPSSVYMYLILHGLLVESKKKHIT